MSIGGLTYSATSLKLSLEVNMKANQFQFLDKLLHEGKVESIDLPHIIEAVYGLSLDQATEIFTEWQNTYEERHRND